MKTCRCGREFRLGVRAQVVGDDGRLVRAIVCRRCANKALCIVLAPPKATPAREVRNPQLDKIKRKLMSFRNMAEVVRSDPDERERAQGALEAYDQAISLIDAAQEGRPL